MYRTIKQFNYSFLEGKCEMFSLSLQFNYNVIMIVNSNELNKQITKSHL